MKTTAISPGTLGLILLVACCSSRICGQESADALLSQARQAEAAGRLPDALKLLDTAAQQRSPAADLFSQRGGVHFKLAHLTESLADFDMQIKLRPTDGPAHWRRGLTLYYAGNYAAGVRQFTTSDRAEPQDVENAVWHLLCNAKILGLEKARGQLLPVHSDRRVPFMEIYALFAGRSSPERVLRRAQAGNPDEREMRQRLFYAHLYAGLDAEMLGKPEQSLAYIQKAVRDYPIQHYMMEVARVHLQLRQPQK
jgi:lipoprotein NlpI